ncbi:MAG: C4-type zinc ribbon domain-containing protein [Candidatus Omnitrophota bacterium]|nr:C4-type zinc ribbon domain-containing protein [Candidatus Omnitrophota bacterium]
MAINLEEQIKLLVEMQGMDTHIFKLEDDLESIPVRIKTSDEEYKNKMGNLKNLEEAYKALQVKKKQKDGDLEAKEGAIKKFQTQMYQVKTNKEYAAFQQEIARTKADISLIEEDIIRLLDEIEEENKNITREKEFLKQEDVKLIEEKKRLNEEAGRIKAELDSIKKQRSAMAEKADRAVLAKYDRIIQNKDGLAVVPVSNESCQGCFRVMPPQVINEIKMKDRLVFCENCARILYINE